MIYSELAIDIGLAFGTVLLIVLCCVCSIVTTLYSNRRQFRPREDSGESLV